MIAYLDTSALVKLYIRESGSGEVRDLVNEATIISTSVVAYPEAMSAFGRAKQEGRISPGQFDQLRHRLSGDWGRFFQVKPKEELIERAAELAVNHSLRGFDSIHLASALVLRTSQLDVRFACYDERLNQAAEEVGLETGENS